MRSRLLAWMLIASTTLVGCSSALHPDSRFLTGTWTGTFTCSQGLTGVTLVMMGTVFGTVGATFDFFPLPENPGVPSGRFAMNGAYLGTGVLELDADESDWIRKPAGYRTVDLTGVVSGDASSYSGTVIGSAGCTSFSTVRHELQVDVPR